MRAHFFSLAIVICGLAASPSIAQQYHFHTYTEMDGLLSSTVQDISQDSEGALWFATARGLSRFDGAEWEDCGPTGNTPTMHHSFIGRDHEGRMWTLGKGVMSHLYVRQNGVWREIEKSADYPPLGNYLAWELGRTPGDKTFIAMAERKGRITIYCDGQWRNYTLDGLDVGLNTLVFVDGRLAIATLQGLYEIDPADWQLRPTALTKPLQTICRSFDGKALWAVGNGWIGLGTPDSMQILAEDLPLEFHVPVEGTAALADPAGGVYFGDLGQVYYFHPRYGLELLSRANGLQSSGVTNFFLDREGHVWVGGLRGPSKLINRSLAGYARRHGLLDDEVTAVLKRRNGTMVLGHFGGLTFMEDDPRPVVFNIDNHILERVSDLAESPDGEIWFAADHLGVGHVKADGTIEYLQGIPNPVDKAYALSFDRQGDLWVGTNKGVVRWDGEQFHTLDLSEFVADHQSVLVRRLVHIQDGSLLIGSGHFGVFRWRDGVLQHSMPEVEGRGRSVYNLHETASGEVLVGTLDGLYILQGEALVKAAAPWPVIDRPIYSILPDTKGQLWFGTDNGVMRWDGEKLTQLTVRDGLLGTETNRDALKLGPRGDLWIGTDRGLTIYRSDFDQEPLALPLITITGFEVDGTRYPGNKPLRLSSSARAIDISFRGVTFQDETRTKYLTWLENFEEGWRGPDLLPNRTMRYTNVPPGTYRFQVQVCTPDGVLSTVARSGEIVVLAPLQARWWFRLLIALVSCVVIWMMGSYLWAWRYTNRLKTMVGERTAKLEQSELLYRAESQRLGATLESISDGVITLDGRDRVVMCNTAAERILGRSQDTILGNKLLATLAVEPAISLTTGEPTVHLVVDPAGGQTWLEFSVAPITDAAQRAIGTVLAFRDITARREIENQRLRTQQLESLGVLAGGIAHDFNNLLTIILGNISLVEDTPAIGREVQGPLNKMKTATESARLLTEQFLTFAKGGDPSLAPESLMRIVRQSATLAFSGASVSCKLELAPDLWNVEVDRGQIGQVLNNLFLNACQAMESGGTVVIKARNSATGTEEPGTGRWVYLEVHDQGVGISEGELKRIFDPYYTTKDQGSGLGLAIAHSIVRRHGGRLTVDSDPGRGSVFTLTLPATDLVVRPDEAAVGTAALPSGRILVMDDEKDVLDVCGRLLKGLGLSCVVTTDGHQTLQMYETALAKGVGFDAVIMDLTVPGGMGGKEAVQLLLEIDPEVRAIVASGYSNDPVLANYQRYGFQGALKKPFDKADLKRELARVLVRKDATA